MADTAVEAGEGSGGGGVSEGLGATASAVWGGRDFGAMAIRQQCRGVVAKSCCMSAAGLGAMAVDSAAPPLLRSAAVATVAADATVGFEKVSTRLFLDILKPECFDHLEEFCSIIFDKHPIFMSFLRAI